MSEIWFVAVERFGPRQGEKWRNYVEWAKLPQLKELITLDGMLCPPILSEPIPEDWAHNVHDHFRTHFFRDLDYLLERVRHAPHAAVLAVLVEPQHEPENTFDDARFSFCGYDLIEEGSGVSAINNCGGFEKAFSNEIVSTVGLISSYDLAKTVQSRLRENYPDEIHADCDLWAIWRMESS